MIGIRSPAFFPRDEPLNRHIEKHQRTRILAALVVLLVIPVGLFARSHRAAADSGTLTGFLATYTGDVLWPVMFYFIGRFFFPSANRWKLAATVLTLTLVIEFGQLWKSASLDWLREQPVIGFLMGNSFIWSDVACLFVGIAVAVGLDVLVTRHRVNPAI